MRGDYWSRLVLCPLDVRVLRATDPSWRRTAGQVGHVAGCAEDVASSALRRLRAHDAGGARSLPSAWLGSHAVGGCDAGAPAVSEALRRARPSAHPGGGRPPAGGRCRRRACQAKYAASVKVLCRAWLPASHCRLPNLT